MNEILLNPNVAYLFLVGGFSLALLAILAPGTSILELGAFFALLLAGWGIYNLPIHIWALIILVIGAASFLWGARKSERVVFLVVAILALIIGSVYLFRSDTWWKPAVNPILAAVTSTLVGGFFWIVATKTLEAETVPLAHDLNPLVGAVGEAKSDIHHEGSVQVQGELWSARSEEPIPEGATVRVTQREGFSLVVEEVEQE